jgi:cell division protein FtsB
MVCLNCNSKIKKNFKTCPKCGADIEKQKQEKKEKIKQKWLKLKCIVALILFLFFVIFLAIILLINLYNKNKNLKEFAIKEENTENDLVVQVADDDELIVDTEEEEIEVTDENKDEDYDNDGLTLEKEVELKTNPYLADTDGDGLNDGEEANVYNTDPLKYSTNDDGISDYTKVKLGLSFDKAYTENEIEDLLESQEVNSEVTLVPSTLEAQAKGKFEEFSIDEKVDAAVKTFSVYGFEGKIEYELDSTNKIILLVEYGGEYTEFDDYQIDGNKMIINIDEDDNAKDFVITTTNNLKKYQNNKGGNN